MKEHNEIDELFRDGLENFKPDATHLSSASVVALLSTKAAASTVVVKTGLLAKWGIGAYIGMATLVVGSTAAVVVYQTTNNPMKSTTPIAGINSKHQAVDSVKQSLFVDSLFTLNSISEMDNSLQLDNETILNEGDQTTTIIQEINPQFEQAVRPEQADRKVKSRFIDEPVQFESNLQLNQPQRQSKLLKKNQLQSFGTFANFAKTQSNPNLATENPKIDELTASNSGVTKTIDPQVSSDIQPIAGIKSGSEQRVDSLTNQSVVAETSLPVSTEIETVNADLSAVGTGLAYYNPFLATEPIVSTYSWPRQHLSLKAGLGYVPLRTELSIYKENIEDTLLLYYNFVETTYQRSSIKNEIGGSFNYQKAMRNNIVFGGGFNFTQGGWKAFTTVKDYFLVDDGFGNLTVVEELNETGEWDVTYKSVGLNLFTGYDFIFNDHWMIGTSIGLNANQVFSKNNFRNYSTGEIESSKFSGFALSVYGAFDLIYRMNHVGISVGGAINGRATTAKIINATDFYNTASFSLNVGFHYFLDQKK